VPFVTDSVCVSRETFAAARIDAVVPSVGPDTGGNFVTITGVGFATDPATVLLAGVQAVVSRQNDTTIVVLSQPGPSGTGQVVVRSDAVGSVSLSNAFTRAVGTSPVLGVGAGSEF
jgi:hypothetical protein